MKCGIRELSLSAALMLCGALSATGAEDRDPIRMRITAQNPHATEGRSISIDKPLPPLPSNITDVSRIVRLPKELELKYDPGTTLYRVVSKVPVELGPRENKSFVVELEDVWRVDPDTLTDLHRRTERALASLAEGDTNYESGQRIAKTIVNELERIRELQDSEGVPREKYIFGYHANLLCLKGIREDIETIESYSKVIGRPTPDMLEDPDTPVDTPTRTVTWLVIFIILTFLGIMAGIFFYVWQRSAKGLETPLSQARDAAFPGSSESEGEEGR